VADAEHGRRKVWRRNTVLKVGKVAGPVDQKCILLAVHWEKEEEIHGYVSPRRHRQKHSHGPVPGGSFSARLSVLVLVVYQVQFPSNCQAHLRWKKSHCVLMFNK